MGNRAVKKQWEKKDRDSVLLLISIGFFLGGLLGCFLAVRLPAETVVEEFLRSAREDAIQPALWREIWTVFRWPAAVVVLSLLPRSGMTIPILIFLRGLVLSCGIAAFITEGAALWCAGLLFGPICLLTVPVLFVLAEEGILQKASGNPQRRSGLTLRTLLCLPVLLVCVFLNQVVVPPLLTWYLS